MKIGIGLPAAVPHVQGTLLLEWARQADAGPFSSLSILDRLVYPNFEPLITLASVASITSRIRLITTVLLATLRNPGILAKQAATLDVLSGGRLTLGLGVGGREDDFLAAPASFHTRGKRFDQQLALMTRVWSGQPVSEKAGVIGPAPARAGGPEVLLGGYSAVAIQRLSRWGEGFIGGGRAPDQTGQFFRLTEEAWQQGGRPGKPRLVGCSYYGLGPQADEGIAAALGDYYSFLGPMVQQMIARVPATPEAIRATIQAYEDQGADEVIFWPAIAELDQIHRLTDVIGG
jgi:alkanesulfonate monooxygenase SsuD/methylene tetrahydromethanopterin reductase-like flavin-dependent oxidoreductase (luciferase family)